MLQEAGSWSGLVREMESYFHTRQLSQVASRLALMRQSLKLLMDLPEAQSRVDVMERMEQRLELLVRPGLKDALALAAKGQIEQLIDSVVVFSNLGRMDALRRDFAASRGVIVSRPLWEAAPTDPDEFTKWLIRFYEGVLRALRDEEAPLCVKAFDDPSDAFQALVAVAADAFSCVAEDLEEKIGLNESKATVQGLDRYVHVFSTMDRFGSSLVAFLRQQQPTEGNTAFDISPATVALAAPFLKILASHQSLETRALSSELERVLDLTNDEDEGFLKPSPQEILVNRIKAKDALEQLTEDCVRRCSLLHGRRYFNVHLYFIFRGACLVFNQLCMRTTIKTHDSSCKHVSSARRARQGFA